MKKTLAELLIDRKVLADSLADLNTRMHNAAVRDKDGAASEDLATLLGQFTETAGQYSKIDATISKVNQVAKLVVGQDLTIADAIAQRDLAKRLAAAFKALQQRVSDPRGDDRWSRDAVQRVATMTVSDLQAQVNTYAKEFRALDVAIQQANWRTEVTL